MKRKSSEPSFSGAWKPRAVLLVLMAAVGTLVVVEVRNLFRRPSFQRIGSGEGRTPFVIYQKGRPASREAWLLGEPQGDAGPPVCFQRIACTPEDERTGALHWAAGGHALYAVPRRIVPSGESGALLWLYEFDTGRLWAADENYVGAALPWRIASAGQLQALLTKHGGRGPLAVSWYELGKRGAWLFAWQITRWENALPRK